MSNKRCDLEMGASVTARIFHQLSTASAYSASSASSDSVGPTQHTAKYASHGLGRLPRIQGGLDAFVTKADEISGLAKENTHGQSREPQCHSLVWKIKGGELLLTPRPLLMGILNVTPDSFFDGGNFLDPDAAVRQGIQLAQGGADILDIGGLSTRPGSSPIPWEEERDRILPVITRLSSAIHIPISVDTYRASVAREALKAGARIVNDVGALRLDSEMASVVADTGSGLILMHMRGDPLTMQLNTHYGNLLEEMLRYLEERLSFARSVGIREEQLLLDPGLGFGKTVEQNLDIIKNLEFFLSLGRPLLVGPSRKSFIGQILQKESHDRLSGTLASVAAAFYHGASVVRVHDVRETRDFLNMLQAVEGAHDH